MTKLPSSSLIVGLTWFRRRVEVGEGESSADEDEEEEEEKQEDDDDGGLVEVEVDDFEKKELDHKVTFSLFNRLPALLTSNLFGNLMEFPHIKH